MPIILYTLETNSASYLSSSSVIPEGYACLFLKKVDSF